MMEDATTRFLKARQKDWRRISGHTRGEHSPEDVQAEAWLMMATLRDKGVMLDLEMPEHQSLLISHLYQHLVRYTELNVRNAVRLDHALHGEEGEVHPLAYMLAADAQSDPVVALMDAEERMQSALERDLGVHESLAAAYVWLLRYFDNRMAAVADHLRISLSYCYQRCRHARLLAIHQQALSATVMAATTDFLPGPWRRFRLSRACVQLSFDFDSDLHLFTEVELPSTPSTAERPACPRGHRW